MLRSLSFDVHEKIEGAFLYQNIPVFRSSFVLVPCVYMFSETCFLAGEQGVSLNGAQIKGTSVVRATSDGGGSSCCGGGGGSSGGSCSGSNKPNVAGVGAEFANMVAQSTMLEFEKEYEYGEVSEILTLLSATCFLLFSFLFCKSCSCMTTYKSIASMQNYILKHLSIDVGLEFGLVEKHTTANLVHMTELL